MIEGWEEKTLGDAITLQRGHDLPRTKMLEGSIPVAGSNGVVGSHNEATTQGPGVTIGRSGNVGNAYFYPQDFWAHNTTLYVKDFKGNDPRFIYYFLTTFDFSQFNAGSAVPTLNRNHIHPIDIEVPKPAEQKAIAKILSSLDDKIDLLHRQNATLEALAETLFRQTFIEEAKDDWEEVELGSIIDIRDGTHDSPKQSVTGNYLITSKHIDSFSIDFSKAYKISTENFDEVNIRSKVKKNDLLFSMIGTLGLLHFVYYEPDYAIKNIGLFRTSQSPWFAKFLYLYLRGEQGRRFIAENSSGTTQQYIALGSLRKLRVVYPSEENIMIFDNIITPNFEKIFANQKQIQTLKGLRDTLLPKLMNGEVRISLD